MSVTFDENGFAWGTTGGGKGRTVSVLERFIAGCLAAGIDPTIVVAEAANSPDFSMLGEFNLVFDEASPMWAADADCLAALHEVIRKGRVATVNPGRGDPDAA